MQGFQSDSESSCSATERSNRGTEIVRFQSDSESSCSATKKESLGLMVDVVSIRLGKFLLCDSLVSPVCEAAVVSIRLGKFLLCDRHRRGCTVYRCCFNPTRKVPALRQYHRSWGA